MPATVTVAAAPAPRVPSIALLDALRLRCLQHGAPATIDHCLQHASAMPATHRAVMLQRLTLALADDRRIGSPSGPVDLQADACDTYHLTVPQVPAAYAAYHVALPQLYHAMVGCQVVLPGTYGFLQQSVACQAALRTAVTAAQVRTALSGWLNWQWAAPAAHALDPHLRGLAGDDPLRPTYLAYALDEDSMLRSDVILALLGAPRASPPMAGGARADSGAQRGQ